MDNWDIEPGSKIRRVELHDRYGGGRQGGIAPSKQSPNVLIFSDPGVGEQHGYADRWVDGEFHYVGEGQTGDQEMKRGNLAIRDHALTGRALRVFWGAGGIVEYAGEFQLANEEPWYFATARESGSATLRKVITFRLLPVGDLEPAETPDRPGRLRVRPRPEPLSTPYRPADESVTTSPRDPVIVDPDLVDRGLGGHARTQNELATWVELHGLEPLSPGSADPDFDLGWHAPGRFVVVEVKSLTGTNQERQLRMGLGQVLDYRQRLTESGVACDAVLAVEIEPPAIWVRTCAANNVRLVWPDTFESLFSSGA